MAIDDNTSYELTGRQVKDLANKVKAKADSASLASVATSGLYSDLTGAPTIPTVYNGTLTIQHNGTSKGTFTANQSSASTVNIETIYADTISPATAVDPITTSMIADGAITVAKLAQAVFDAIYPIGSIYMSATMSTAAQVGTAFGGTWVAWGTGKVPVGVDTSDTDFDAAEETGGSKTHSHPLGNSGAAGIRNISGTTYCVAGATGVNDLSHMDGTSNSVYAWNHNNDSSTTTNQAGVRLYGNTETKTTMPPYITCYMYKRTA